MNPRKAEILSSACQEGRHVALIVDDERAKFMHVARVKFSGALGSAGPFRFDAANDSIENGRLSLLDRRDGIVDRE